MFHEVGQRKDMDCSLASHSEVEDNKTCSICMGDIVEKTTLEKCGHSFCHSCLDQAFKVKKACPVCRLVYGQLIGNQPANGTMIVERDPDLELPGHEGYGCVCIIYIFPPGLQSVSRPRAIAFLPLNVEIITQDNIKNIKILALKLAFFLICLLAVLLFGLGLKKRIQPDQSDLWNESNKLMKSENQSFKTYVFFSIPEALTPQWVNYLTEF